MNINFEKYITFDNFLLASTKNDFKSLTKEILTGLNELAFNHFLSPILANSNNSSLFIISFIFLTQL